jgi:hypothetical protein
MGKLTREQIQRIGDRGGSYEERVSYDQLGQWHDIEKRATERLARIRERRRGASTEAE